MTKYYCTKCRYRFAPKGVKGMPKLCPYCGKADTLKEEETADSLIRDVDKMVDF